MKNSGKKLGNGGFSLVELIVGVFILAIIVGPLLHAFLVSARTTARAKETRNQTVAAQNIVETLDAVSIGDILQNMGDPSYTLGGIAKVNGLYSKDINGNYIPVPAGDYTDGETAYTFGMTDINGKYEALVELDTAGFATNLSDRIVVDTQMEAVFTQPSGVGGPDWQAAEEFAQLARIDSGNADIDVNDFLHNMKRTVTIRVVKNADGETKIECSAQYHYEAKYTWDIYDTTKSPAKYLSTQTVTYTKDYDDSVFYSGSAGVDGRLSVYFFFYPNYYTGNDLDDIFDIYNMDDLKIDVFLIKQKTPNPNAPEYDLPGLSGYENGYNARVYIRQSANATLDEDTLNTNITENLAEGPPLNGSVFRIYKGAIPYIVPTPDGMLVKTEQQNRLYYVTVSLYKKGELFTGADPLMTFDASIIE